MPLLVSGWSVGSPLLVKTGMSPVRVGSAGAVDCWKPGRREVEGGATAGVEEIGSTARVENGSSPEVSWADEDGGRRKKRKKENMDMNVSSVMVGDVALAGGG